MINLIDPDEDRDQLKVPRRPIKDYRKDDPPEPERTIIVGGFMARRRKAAQEKQPTVTLRGFDPEQAKVLADHIKQKKIEKEQRIYEFKVTIDNANDHTFEICSCDLNNDELKQAIAYGVDASESEFELFEEEMVKRFPKLKSIISALKDNIHIIREKTNATKKGNAEIESTNEPTTTVKEPISETVNSQSHQENIMSNKDQTQTTQSQETTTKDEAVNNATQQAADNVKQTIDNTAEAAKNATQQATNVVNKTASAASKPSFFSRNKKKLIIGGSVVVGAVGGYFAWQRWGGSLFGKAAEAAEAAGEVITS